jgi:Fe-S-cluster containining protein
VTTGARFLKFRCTGCGNCCKDPLLPLTDADITRIIQSTGEDPADLIRWVDRNGIDMDDEPEAFVMLRHGKRVMTLRHERGGCRYLDRENRCTVYDIRPLGCRVFPFDPTFTRTGTLRRLKLIQATDCVHELDGSNEISSIRSLQEQHDNATRAYQERIAEWNRVQRSRKRSGKKPQSARQFLEFLGLYAKPAVPEKRPRKPRPAATRDRQL